MNNRAALAFGLTGKPPSGIHRRIIMHKCILTGVAALLLNFTHAFAADVAPGKGVKPAFASDVTITVDGAVRIIRSNGIPNHETGQFPNRGNPNTIAPQRYDFRMPAEPKAAEKATALRMQPFGIAINGVLFDPGAAEWWNGDRASGWQYEPLAGGGMLGV